MLHRRPFPAVPVAPSLPVAPPDQWLRLLPLDRQVLSAPLIPWLPSYQQVPLVLVARPPAPPVP